MRSHNIVLGFLSLCMPVMLYLLIGCASIAESNGIEGTVIYFGTNRPAANITVEANAGPNVLKKEIPKAIKTVKTNDSGHFKITDLLPNKSYKIQVKGSLYQTATFYETVFAKGTIKMQQPIQAIPIPQYGIWIFTDNPGSMMHIDGDSKKRVQIKVHEGLIGGGFGNVSAFSVSDEDIEKSTMNVSKNGVLLVKGNLLADFARLFKIPQKMVSLGTNSDANIPAGWYYNVSDFYGEDFMIVGSKLLKPRVEEPSIIEAVKSEEQSLWALPLSSLPNGYYFLTGGVQRENFGSVLGGENHPQGGYIIKVE